MKTKLAIFMLAAFLMPFAASQDVNAKEPSSGPTYALTNSKSTLNWKGTKPGGEHYGVVDVIDGKIQTDGETITGGSFAIDLTTIINHDLDNETFNKKLVNHLKSEDFFHVEEHPKAYFNIKKVKEGTYVEEGFSGTHSITGDLTIRGITKEVTFPVSIKMKDDIVMAESGTITLDRTEWNVNYNSKKLLGNMADNYIDDQMVVSLDLRFDIK